MVQESIEVKHNAENEPGKSPSPPYTSFLTFQNFITWLETEGIPLKFDRSFWGTKYGGSVGMQLISGLRFLGLLKDDVPQPQLEEIIKTRQTDERNVLLNKMFRDSYLKVDFTTLERATPAMLNDMFKAYDLDGSTLRKAVSFFINGCKAYNIPLSNSLKKKARNKAPMSGPKPVRKLEPERKSEIEQNKTSDGSEPKVEIPPGSQRQPLTQEQTFRLRFPSGREITLSINATLFDISDEEWACIRELRDVIKKHKK